MNLSASVAPAVIHAKKESEEAITSLFVAITTYLGYAVLIFYGHVRDFFGKVTGWSRYYSKQKSKNREVCI